MWAAGSELGPWRSWGTVSLGLGTSELLLLHMVVGTLIFVSRLLLDRATHSRPPGEALMEILSGLFVPFFLENTPAQSHKPLPLFCRPFPSIAFLAIHLSFLQSSSHGDGDGCCQVACADQDQILAVSCSLRPQAAPAG